jgi:hypothetical protein
MNILGFTAIVFGCMLVAPLIVGLLLVAVTVIAGYMAGVISAIVEAAADASEEFRLRRNRNYKESYGKRSFETIPRI